ncbi:MAG: prephenate dehydrogenase/arogenate dehydrogenase family protein [Armatimonadota bacterium]|nr:prephenate dehydrogenase/arogenate dehydrogenase family protein [Armatimonadota bacterium]
MTDEGSFPTPPVLGAGGPSSPPLLGAEGLAQFGTVAIIGVGLIGGSLGMALKTRRLAANVVGIGRRPERLQQAVQMGAIDRATTDLHTGLADADIVVLCTTIGNILETLPDVLEHVKADAVVTDVGSAKTQIVARAQSAPHFVGSHPMAGSERTGVEAATPLLFQEATWALTPTDDTDPRALQTIRTLAQEIGAATLVLPPETHDALVAVTSHLPHVMASALMRQAADIRAQTPEIRRLAAGSFADMTRVAAASPDIWRDVCLSNRDAILSALTAYRAQLDALQAAVEAADPAALEAFFAEGAAAKRDWSAS